MKSKKVEKTPEIIDKSSGDGETKIFKVFDIGYDTDGHRVPGLPKVLFFKVDADIEPSIELGDYISDQTGWCHYGYNFEEIKEPASASKAGYTTTELLIAILFVFVLVLAIAAIGGGGYVAFHFIQKVW